MCWSGCSVVDWFGFDAKVYNWVICNFPWHISESDILSRSTKQKTSVMLGVPKANGMGYGGD
ncbi:hypothetical protein SOVF_124100 isoform A [Spinacia oleracea]|nr:hypothetical protein SOVF_124100 isoform A [Spinacia oleracea]